MVSPDRITNATLETIESLYIVIRDQHRRSVDRMRYSGTKQAKHALDDAINQLNLVTQKKYNLLIKKKLVI